MSSHRISLFLLGTLIVTQPVCSSEISPPRSPDQCNRGTSASPFSPNLTTCLDSSILSPSAWLPWTHIPHCVSSSAAPYCVFTRATSPRPLGLSVVATPDEAAGALNPLQHAHDGDDDDGTSSFFAPEKLYRPRPYEVRDVPGKGKGAVVTRRIEKGRAVLVDYACVLAAVEYPGDVKREEVQELLEVAAARLSEPERARDLARRGEREAAGAAGIGGVGRDKEEERGQYAGDGGMSLMEDVMLTNTFGVTIGGKDYMGLFADLARFNHACKPNAFIHFSETTLAMTVWTSRDIEPGEEITITYSPAGLTSTERRETLQKVWGFECHCSLCSAPPDVVNASDARRTEIRGLQDRVISLAQKGRFHQAIEAAERLFDLVDQEGLTEQMGGMYEVPARLYYHVGNLEKALEYTLKVKHEIDGYGIPGKLGFEKIKMLEGVVERIKQEMGEREGRAEEQELNSNRKKDGKRVISD